jgi:hypothetical protein
MAYRSSGIHIGDSFVCYFSNVKQMPSLYPWSPSFFLQVYEDFCISPDLLKYIYIGIVAGQVNYFVEQWLNNQYMKKSIYITTFKHSLFMY